MSVVRFKFRFNILINGKIIKNAGFGSEWDTLYLKQENGALVFRKKLYFRRSNLFAALETSRRLCGLRVSFWDIYPSNSFLVETYVRRRYLVEVGAAAVNGHK